jgi:hypothetical protein
MTAAPGITVFTTTGHQYDIAAGASTDSGVGPTGELTAEVFGADPGDGPPWLGSFGNVEAVYVAGEVIMQVENASARRGL